MVPLVPVLLHFQVCLVHLYSLEVLAVQSLLLDPELLEFQQGLLAQFRLCFLQALVTQEFRQDLVVQLLLEVQEIL